MTAQEAALRSEKRADAAPDGERIGEFADIDLESLGVPVEAWPLKNKHYMGRKGYTVTWDSGAAAWLFYCPLDLNEAVEVLVYQRAYVVKRIPPPPRSGASSSAAPRARTGQVTWSKYGGPLPAWEEAKIRAGVQ